MRGYPRLFPLGRCKMSDHISKILLRNPMFLLYNFMS